MLIDLPSTLVSLGRTYPKQIVSEPTILRFINSIAKKLSHHTGKAISYWIHDPRTLKLEKCFGKASPAIPASSAIFASKGVGLYREATLGE